MEETRKNEIWAVVLFALSLFLFLSIFSFSEQDLSFYTSSPNVVARNATGITGSYIGGFLLFFVGQAAYVLPLLILVWALSRLFQIEARKVYFKLFGTVVLVVAVSASLSMLADLNRTLAFAQGGLIGTLVSDFLLEYLGRLGATVFIAAMIILSLLIATEFLILPILAGMFKFLAKAPSRIRSGLPKRAPGAAGDLKARSNKLKLAREEMARKLEKMKEQVEEVRKTSLASRFPSEKNIKPIVKAEPKVVIPREPQKVSAKPVCVTPLSDSSTGEKIDYKLPGIDLFRKPLKADMKDREEDLKNKAAILENTLLEFGVEAKVVKINRGPVITMYELEPAMGT
ncbi:DNA translocase FtsK 4TM domain-containing protein, partial [Candidatus Omnitrophota bacterium]